MKTKPVREYRKLLLQSKQKNFKLYLQGFFIITTLLAVALPIYSQPPPNPYILVCRNFTFPFSTF